MTTLDSIPTRGSFRPTPAWPIFGLLGVEGLLWLSVRCRWFWFNKLPAKCRAVGTAHQFAPLPFESRS